MCVGVHVCVCVGVYVCVCVCEEEKEKERQRERWIESVTKSEDRWTNQQIGYHTLKLCVVHAGHRQLIPTAMYIL